MAEEITPTSPTEENGITWAWVGCGLGLLTCGAALSWLSRSFVYGTEMLHRPIPLLIGLLMLSALVYFAAIHLAKISTPTRKLAYFIFGVGALMRLLVAPSLPILEDDYYRYLWDGGVTAQGVNPYTTIPADVQARRDSVEAPLLQLADDAGIVLHRVNHPQLGTVYPPVAQVAFAVAHWIAPWHLAGLRLLYYGVDCIAFGLLVLLLRQLKQSPLLSLIYWWNPLLVEEVYNSVHMDILLVPFLLGVVLLVLQGQIGWSMVPLALATATKLWPVLLVVPVLALIARDKRRLLLTTGIFIILSGALLSPLLSIRSLGDDSGFLAYGARWEMNDALFMVFPWTISTLSGLLSFPVDPALAHRGGRLIAAGLVGLVALSMAWRAHRLTQVAGDGSIANWTLEHRLAWCRGLCWIVAALFLLSPTQFPWYFVWLLPFLTITPNRALLGLTFVLPLYYLRFYFDARDMVDVFHNQIVWLEFGPILLWLLFDGYRARRNPAP